VSRLKPPGFNNIEDVEENSVSPDMDVWLAFEVQDVPPKALAFSNKAEEHQNEVKSWIQPRREIIAFQIILMWRLGVPRGNSRWFPLGLVWAKRHDVSGRRP
jgi:hypothetical protein